MELFFFLPVTSVEQRNSNTESLAPPAKANKIYVLAACKQIFSMHDQWNCYKASEESRGGKGAGVTRQLFSMRRCSVLRKGHEAEVFMMSGRGNASDDTTGQGRPQQQLLG
jgi:hypothetical protein